MGIPFILDKEGYMWGLGSSIYNVLPVEVRADDPFKYVKSTSNSTADYNGIRRLGDEKWKQVIRSSFVQIPTFAIKEDGTLWACGLSSSITSSSQEKDVNGNYDKFVMIDGERWAYLIHKSFTGHDEIVLGVKEDGSCYHLANYSTNSNFLRNISAIQQYLTSDNTLSFLKKLNYDIQEIYAYSNNTTSANLGIIFKENDEYKILKTQSNPSSPLNFLSSEYVDIPLGGVCNVTKLSDIKLMECVPSGFMILRENGDLLYCAANTLSIGNSYPSFTGATEPQVMATGVEKIQFEYSNFNNLGNVNTLLVLYKDGSIGIGTDLNSMIGSLRKVENKIVLPFIVKDVFAHNGVIFLIDEYGELYSTGYKNSSNPTVHSALSFSPAYQPIESPVSLQYKKHHHRFKEVKVTTGNIFALDEDNILWGKGSNANYLIHPDDKNWVVNFKQVSSLTIKGFFLGDEYLDILTTEGELYTVGTQSSAQGLMSSSVKVNNLTKVSDVKFKKIEEDIAGNCFALTEDGRLFGRGGIAKLVSEPIGTMTGSSTTPSIFFSEITTLSGISEFSLIENQVTNFNANSIGGILVKLNDGKLYYGGSHKTTTPFLKEQFRKINSYGYCSFCECTEEAQEAVKLPLKYALAFTSNSINGTEIIVDAENNIYGEYSNTLTTTKSILGGVIDEGIHASVLNKEHKGKAIIGAKMLNNNLMAFITEDGFFVGGTELDFMSGIPYHKTYNNNTTFVIGSRTKDETLTYFHPIPIRSIDSVYSEFSTIITSEGQMLSSGKSKTGVMDALRYPVHCIPAFDTQYYSFNAHNITRSLLNNDTAYYTHELLTATLKARNIYQIDHFELKGNVPENTKMKMLFSKDKITWETFSNGSWSTANPSEILEDGMSIQEVNNLAKVDIQKYSFDDFYVLVGLYTTNEKYAPSLNSFDVYVDVNSVMPAVSAASITTTKSAQITPTIKVESDGHEQEIPHGEVTFLEHPSTSVKISLEIDEDVSVDGYAATYK